MESVRSLIAKRLKYEMKRKIVSEADLSSISSIEKHTISDYLAGKREIKFDELQKICDALKCNMFYLISHDYEEAKLAYRITGGQAENTVCEIENITKLFIDLLAEPKKEKYTFNPTDLETSMLLPEIEDQVKFFRKNYNSVEKIYEAYDLPVVAISAGDKDSFDSFLLTIGKKAIVYVNQDKPIERIYFSLLHEIAHFLYHKNIDIPVTFIPIDLYSSTLNAANLPEYFANKFAQLYLVSLNKAGEFYEKISRQGLTEKLVKESQQYIVDKKISKQTFGWALKDYFIMHHQNQSILRELDRQLTNNKTENNSLVKFLDSSKKKVEFVICQRKKEFSEEAILKLNELLGFAL